MSAVGAVGRSIEIVEMRPTAPSVSGEPAPLDEGTAGPDGGGQSSSLSSMHGSSPRGSVDSSCAVAPATANTPASNTNRADAEALARALAALPAQVSEAIATALPLVAAAAAAQRATKEESHAAKMASSMNAAAIVTVLIATVIFAGVQDAK